MGFFDVIAKINDVCGVLAIFFSFLFGIGLKRFAFRVKQWRYRLKHGAVQSNGYIIIVGDEGTKDDVMKYIKNDSQLSKIHDDAICLVNVPKTFTPEDMPKFLDHFIKCRNITKKHSTQNLLHLFMRSPIVVGAIIGGYLYNKGAVYLYHYQDSTYTNYGLLNTRN